MSDQTPTDAAGPALELTSLLPPDFISEEYKSEQDIDHNEDAKSPLEGEELKKALIEQLENIFTKEYLASDPFFVSQLSHDFWVPIALIENLPVIKMLCTDPEIINEAIRSSDKIVVDEEKKLAKPSTPLVQRNTIILRDLPEDINEDQIKALFNNDGAKFLPAITEMKPEVSNTFFIKFNDETITQEAFTYLRSQKINDQPVQARIKSENLLKSFYYASPVPTSYSYTPYQNDGNVPRGAYPPNWQTRPNFKGQGGYPKGEYPRNFESPRGKGGRGTPRKRKDFRGRSFEGNEESISTGGRRNIRGKRGGGGPSGLKTDSTRRPNTNNNVLSMAPSQWPPLPSSQDRKKGKVSGYRGDFKKYPKEHVISVISAIKEEIKPVWLESCPPAILDSGYHEDLEVLKAVPKDAKVEWQEAKRKLSGATRNRSVSGRKRGSSHSENLADKKQENDVSVQNNAENNVSDAQKNGVQTQQPASVWPTVASSSVKKPPTNAQKKGQRKPQSNLKYQPRENQTQQQQGQNQTQSPQAQPQSNKLQKSQNAEQVLPSATTSSSSPLPPQQDNNNNPPSSAPKPAEQSIDTAQSAPKANGPSYADIARSNNSTSD